LAVFGLPALSVAIALFVLWGLRPWEDSTEPHEVPLGIEATVGDGKALPVPSTAHVGAGAPVSAGPRAQAARRTSGGTVPSPNSSPASSPSNVAVAPARGVAVAEVPSSPAAPAPESGRDEEVPTVGTTAGEVPTEETSSSAATPAGSGGGSQGPVAAGAKPPLFESCEGDEYVIAVTFLDEESAMEEAPVSIVLERLNEDGTTDELKLEGDLSDARALALRLEAEGNCVEVEIARADGEESAEEVPGAGEEAPESSGTPEPSEEVTEPAESPLPSSP
jgi:hypothetical protein